MNKIKTKKESIKVNKHLKEIVIYNHKGKLIHKIITPLMPEFHRKDILQVIVGASILAIPVGFTEETWHLGEILPLPNTIILLFISILFISTFVYYNYYMQHGIKNHYKNFIVRSISTYILSFIVVAILLTTIEKAPWIADTVLALKRTIIVSFPSSMSAAVADMIR